MKKSNFRLSMSKCNLTKKQKDVIRKAWYKVRDEMNVEYILYQACCELMLMGTADMKVPTTQIGALHAQG